MPELVYWMTHREWCLLNTPQHIGCLQHFATFGAKVRIGGDSVLPPSSVGEMTLRLYGALSYSQNSACDLRRALDGA